MRQHKIRQKQRRKDEEVKPKKSLKKGKKMLTKAETCDKIKKLARSGQDLKGEKTKPKGHEH